LLLHCDGVDGGNVFTDSSNNHFTPTIAGTPTTSTTQVKFGPTSYKGADGSGLNYASDPAFGYGVGEYTLETWVYIPSVPAIGESILIDCRGLRGDAAPFLAFN